MKKTGTVPGEEAVGGGKARSIPQAEMNRAPRESRKTRARFPWAGRHGGRA